MINNAAARGELVPGYEDKVPAIEWGDDFGSPHETYLTKQFEKPLFVHHYPPAVKAFYMEPESERPEVCRSVDLLAPEGYGEIIGGSERMSNPEKVIAAIERHKLPKEVYEWYTDLRRYGSVVHSGFGLGVGVQWRGFAGSIMSARTGVPAYAQQFAPINEGPSYARRLRLIPMVYWLVFICAFALTLLLTPVAGWVGQQFDLVDHPGGRRQRQGIIPRTGGIAIFGGFFLTLLLTILLPEILPD